MKPRNREINIFNLSMMDVISGALGAFLIIVIILFPYYRKDIASENRELREKLNAAETALAQAEEARQQVQQSLERAEQARRQAELARQQAEQARQQAEQARLQAEQAAQQANTQLQQAQQALKDCRERENKTFMVIVIKWQTLAHDVDLHVIDPSGAEFFYQRKSIPGRPGELSEDDQLGPGNEVWEVRQAPPGKYKVYYNLYNRHGNSQNPVVSGRVFYRDGSKEFRDITLTRDSYKTPVAIITVKENGDVEIESF